MGDLSPNEVKILEEKENGKKASCLLAALRLRKKLSNIIKTSQNKRKKKSKSYSIDKVLSPSLRMIRNHNVHVQNKFNSSHCLKGKFALLTNPICPNPDYKFIADRKILRLEIDPPGGISVKTYLSNSTSKQSQGTIVDSGARANVSSVREDFAEIYEKRTVKVAGVGGKLQACWGKLRPNRLFPEKSINREAVYCKQLPVLRLFSTAVLNENGWDVVLAGNGKQHYLSHPQRSEYIGLTKNPDGSGLPFIENIQFCYTNLREDLSNVRSAYMVKNESSADDDVCSTDAEIENDKWDSSDEEEEEFCPEIDLTTSKPYKDARKKVSFGETEFKDRIEGAESEIQIPNRPFPPRPRKSILKSLTSPSTSINQRKLPVKLSREQRFLIHCRRGHIGTEDEALKVGCRACLEGKGRKQTNKKARDLKHKADYAFSIFDADFFGPLEQSYRKNRMVVVFVCQRCKLTIIKPIVGKHQVDKVVKEVVEYVREQCGHTEGDPRPIFRGLRTDNEPAWDNTTLQSVAKQLGITRTWSTPWCPRQNGLCERRIQTVKGLLRSTMKGVDPKTWDFALEFIQEALNEHGTKTNTTPPLEVLRNYSTNPVVNRRENRLHHARRFGCLAFAKINPTSKKQKRFPGINLGFSSKHSCYQIGKLNRDDTLSVYSTRDVIFDESVLVGSLKRLRDTTALTLRQMSEDICGKASEELSMTDGVSSGTGATLDDGKPNLGMADGTGDSFKVDDPPESTPNPSLSEKGKDISIERSIKRARQISPDKVDKRLKLATSVDEESRMTDGNQASGTTGHYPTMRQLIKQAAASFGPSAGTKLNNRGRGRPAGSKDRSPRKRRTYEEMAAAGESPKKRKRRRRKSPDNIDAEEMVDKLEAYYQALDAEENFWEFEPGEELTQTEIFLADIPEQSEIGVWLNSVNSDTAPSAESTDAAGPVSAKEAEDENGPQYPQWVAARNKELAKLLAHRCWKRIEPEDYHKVQSGRIKPVPSCLLCSKKRDGSFKVRCVILGNRIRSDPNTKPIETFAGVVCPASNRQCLVEAAHNRWSCIPADFISAYIQAELQQKPGEDPIVMSLPKPWVSKGGGPRGALVVLLRAMYGLPSSARTWRLCLGKSLEELGFQESRSTPGVFRWLDEQGKVKHVLTCYVDDVILLSETKELGEEMLRKVKSRHAISRIEPKRTETKNGALYETFDILGCDMTYCQEHGQVSFTMKSYTEKLLRDLGMSDAKPASTPWFDTALLTAPSPRVEFNLRKVCGSLQWLCSTARPDLQVATQMIAQKTNAPAPKAIVSAVKSVLRYVRAAIDVGIHYDRNKTEKEFQETYKQFLEHPENKNRASDGNFYNRCQSFCDASYGANAEFKSTTGQAHYYRGCLVAWRSSKQTVTAASICECEWRAVHDSLRISHEANALSRFLNGENELDETNYGPIWTDNRSVTVSARKEAEIDLNRKSRHVAIRMAKVRENGSRLLFTPTWSQRADGLTKLTNNRMVYEMLFGLQHVKEKQEERVPCLLAYAIRPPKSSRSDNTVIGMLCEVQPYGMY